MYCVFIALLSLFAVYGLVCLVLGLYKKLMHRCIDGKYVIVTVKDNDAESAVRCILRENPDSEVIVINKAASPDTAEVLMHLENDFPQVHIV